MSEHVRLRVDQRLWLISPCSSERRTRTAKKSPHRPPRCGAYQLDRPSATAPGSSSRSTSTTAPKLTRGHPSPRERGTPPGHPGPLAAEKMPEVRCLDCGQPFEQITGRGRPGKYCRACGDKLPPPIAAGANRPKPAPPPEVHRPPRWRREARDRGTCLSFVITPTATGGPCPRSDRGESPVMLPRAPASAPRAVRHSSAVSSGCSGRKR